MPPRRRSAAPRTPRPAGDFADALAAWVAGAQDGEQFWRLVEGASEAQLPLALACVALWTQRSALLLTRHENFWAAYSRLGYGWLTPDRLAAVASGGSGKPESLHMMGCVVLLLRETSLIYRFRKLSLNFSKSKV
jgi:hypothetical protein